MAKASRKKSAKKTARRSVRPIRIETVLAATDLSPNAQVAVAMAAEVAQMHRAKLLVAHVVEGWDQRYDFLVKEITQKLMKDTRAKVRAELKHLHQASPVPVEVVVKKGQPGDHILKLAKERTPGLVVIGAHYGESNRPSKLGTVAEKLLRLSPVPVLVTRPSASPDITRIVCAADGSPCSRHALNWAVNLARLEGLKTLTVVNAFEVPTGYMEAGLTYTSAAAKMRKLHREILQKSCRRHGKAGVRLKLLIEEGPAEDVIVKAARQERADLIVIGTHSRSLFASFLLGSVATKVVRNAPTCTLVVKDKKHRLGLLAALARI